GGIGRAAEHRLDEHRAGGRQAAPAHRHRPVSEMTGAPELVTSPAAAIAAAEEGAPDVCLVTMPYASPTRPSMALGLLKAILAEGGITASVAYANLWLAESAGLRRYSLGASQLAIAVLAGAGAFGRPGCPHDPPRAQ